MCLDLSVPLYEQQGPAFPSPFPVGSSHAAPLVLATGVLLLLAWFLAPNKRFTLSLQPAETLRLVFPS